MLFCIPQRLIQGGGELPAGDEGPGPAPADLARRRHVLPHRRDGPLLLQELHRRHQADPGGAPRRTLRRLQPLREGKNQITI